MESAESILVIILASFLALFLLIGIILLVNLVRLVKKLNEIAEAAGDLVHNVESAAELFKKTSGQIATGKFLVNVFDKIMKKRKDK